MGEPQRTIKQHVEDLQRAISKLKASIGNNDAVAVAKDLGEVDYEFLKLWECVVEDERQRGQPFTE